MQAIILAAGMGRRLGELTSSNTKCMVKVNGVRLIDRMLHQLMKLNLSRIIIVIGHQGNSLQNYLILNYPDLNIIFVKNNVFDKTNNIYSLWLTREFMADEETLLLESDLIFEDAVLKLAVDSKYKDCALVSKYQTWNDGTMVRIDDDNNIVNFIPKKAFKYSDTQYYYKTVNIYKFSKEFITNHYLPFLDAYIKVLGENEYYEQVLRVITLIDSTGIKALPISNLRWYEIDDVQDLKIAETIFASPEQRLEKLQKSYGGYWRYPYLLDFCYLVNPYFPPQRMIEEIKANFEPLLRDYPSGMGVNSLLAAKYFGLKHEYTVIGNGAAELIKSLMGILPGKTGVILPTFEEYPNRKENSEVVKFYPSNNDFRYSANDVIEFYDENPVQNLLIVNPDNPSGNMLTFQEIEKILKWSLLKHINLIIDESFVDFSESNIYFTLLRNDILKTYPHLFVIKSISKSYGVPGLRLGILANSNKEMIERIRKDVSIWNINSFAEFYLQIYNKYENDYMKACSRFQEDREIFYEQLKEIPYLSVIPSQANYFLCEVNGGLSSHDLTLKLLTNYNILIKDCSSKIGFQERGQYVRIAIRNRRDNDNIIEALKQLI